MGDTAHQVLVIDWVVAVGEAVGEGEALLTAETDKVDAEVPAPIGGRLVEQLVAQGDEVAVGEPIAVIEA